MATSDTTALLFVQMTAKADQEAAFNAWYENEYIPAFKRDIPGIVRARRFVTLSPDGAGTNTYLTIYEFRDEAALHKGLDVMKSREEWRKAWKDWEGRAVETISDGLYRTTVSDELKHACGSASGTTCAIRRVGAAGGRICTPPRSTRSSTAEALGLRLDLDLRAPLHRGRLPAVLTPLPRRRRREDDARPPGHADPAAAAASSIAGRRGRGGRRHHLRRPARSRRRRRLPRGGVRCLRRAAQGARRPHRRSADDPSRRVG